jgi:hypothetical protein
MRKEKKEKRPYRIRESAGELEGFVFQTVDHRSACAGSPHPTTQGGPAPTAPIISHALLDSSFSSSSSSSALYGVSSNNNLEGDGCCCSSPFDAHRTHTHKKRRNMKRIKRKRR